VAVNIPDQKATIHFKSGERISVEFRKGSSYPRTYSYRVENGDWVDLGKDPER
jgi:hypothetical protein